MARKDYRRTLPGAMGDRDLLQGDKAALPDTRFHQLQRECGEVADMGEPFLASTFEIYPPSCEVEAQLFATRGRGAWKPLAEEETSLDSGTLWDNRSGDFTDATYEKPLFQPLLNFANTPMGQQGRKTL